MPRHSLLNVWRGVRALAYDDVGTVGGIPAGNIAQLEQVTLNGVLYTLRTLIQYVDAPEDGLDLLDENGITADYKLVKVEATWNVKSSARSLFAVTHIAPKGIESLTGGGTLRVNVFDATAAPVEGASVRIVNNTANPAIDVTAQTNSAGSVAFPGTPEEVDYEIYVSKSGFSSAQTYGVTVENPNPSPNHVAVVEGQTTTMSFAIDTLGTLRTLTFEPPGPGSFDDTFTNQSNLLATSSVTVVDGALVLEDTAGVYETSGNAFSTYITPSLLVSWNELTFASSTPENTAVAVRLYYFDGAVYTLVPDSDVPNNSTGLSGGTTDISSLNTATYSSLQLGAALTTADTSTTSELLDWSVSYIAGPTPLANVPFTIVGSKTIGTDSGGAPLYKYDETFTTSSSGEWTIDPIEWDAYTLELANGSGYDISERCDHDVSVLPNENKDVSVTVVPDTAHTVRIAVFENNNAVADALVDIDSGTYSENANTSSCGQVFFDALVEDTYTLTVSKSGFQTHMEDVAVSGDDVVVVTHLFLNSMKPITHRGFTFLEAIVATSIVTIVMVAIVNSVLFFYRANTSSIEQAYQIDSARRGIEFMVRDLREMSHGDNGAYPILEMASTSVTFYSDTDKDASVEQITYDVSATTTLTRTVVDASGTPPEYTGGGVSSIVSTFVRNLEEVQPIFRYYDGTGTEITNYDDVANVRSVTVNIVVNIQPIRRPDEFTLRSSATLRNLRDE